MKSLILFVMLALVACDQAAMERATYPVALGDNVFLYAAHEAPPSWSGAIVIASFDVRVSNGGTERQALFTDIGGGRVGGVRLMAEPGDEGWTLDGCDRAGTTIRKLGTPTLAYGQWYAVDIIHDNSNGLVRVNVDGVGVMLDQGRHDLFGTFAIGHPGKRATMGFEVAEIRYYERGPGEDNCELCGSQPVNRPEPAYQWSTVFEAGALPPEAYRYDGATALDGVPNEGYGDTVGVLTRYRPRTSLAFDNNYEPTVRD